MPARSPPLFLLLLLLLLSVLSYAAAQPQFNASIAGITAVAASAAVAPFASPEAPYDLTYNATNVTVTLIASSALSYQIFMTGSGGIKTPSDWRGGSLIAGASVTFMFGTQRPLCVLVASANQPVESRSSRGQSACRCEAPWLQCAHVTSLSWPRTTSSAALLVQTNLNLNLLLVRPPFSLSAAPPLHPLMGIC